MIALGFFLIVATAIVVGSSIGTSSIGMLVTGGLALYGAVLIVRGIRMWRERHHLEGASNWAISSFVVGGVMLCVGIVALAYAIAHQQNLIGPLQTSAHVEIPTITRTNGGKTSAEIFIENTGETPLEVITVRIRILHCVTGSALCEEVADDIYPVTADLLSGEADRKNLVVSFSPVAAPGKVLRWHWLLHQINGIPTENIKWLAINATK